jgi:hypothetical protein
VAISPDLSMSTPVNVKWDLLYAFSVLVGYDGISLAINSQSVLW